MVEGIYYVSRRTYEGILDVELVISALDRAAVVDGDHFGGRRPVSIVLLEGEHVALGQNYPAPIRKLS